MESMSISPQVNVSHCSQCQGDTEYNCLTCGHHLCPPCKRSHVISLDTKHHDVMFYRGKFNSISNSETCVTHPDQVYVMYCEPCDLPVCFHCRKHRQHKLQNIKTIYEHKQQQSKDIIINIRSETLYNAKVLYNGKVLQTVVKSDVTTCEKKTVQLHSAMLTKSQILKDSMYALPSEIRVENKCLLIHKLGKQMMKMKRYLTMIQIYEHRYEQLAYRPVQFLQFIKNARFPRIQDTPHLTQHCQLSLTQEINMEDLIELLSELQITEGGKRKLQAGNELLLTLLPSPVLQKSTAVKGVYNCYHISCVTPDRVWVSDYVHDKGVNNLILTDTTTGDKLHGVDDSLRYSWTGFHTVNSECELIYIDKKSNINKLSSDMKTTTTFIKKPKSPWYTLCVYCSPSSGDLLVGMWRLDTETWTYTGEVRRYNNTGELTQTIPHNNTHHKLYEEPNYITENNYGDVVVTDDYRAVVVTDREGRHRFSYRGPPSGSGLHPWGICTDTLSHILIGDDSTHTVQMINKDGDFLSYLLTTESPGIHGTPRSLSYDVNTHVLYVGSFNNNRMSVFRYIDRHRDLTDNVEVCDDVSVRRSSPSKSIPGYLVLSSQEEFDLFSAKEKAREAAEEAEKIAARAKAAATETAEAAVKANVEPEEKIAAEAAANAASEAAEKAAKEAAAAITAADAAAKAETIEAAETAAKAATEAKTRAEVATESILSDYLYY